MSILASSLTSAYIKKKMLYIDKTKVNNDKDMI